MVDWEETLKEVFPELRKLQGRFFGLFANSLYEELQKKVENWAIWARLELGTKKCYDNDREPICEECENAQPTSTYGVLSCKIYPQLGQTWGSDPEGTPACLTHPNTGEWYWCIRECPDFKKKQGKEG